MQTCATSLPAIILPCVSIALLPYLGCLNLMQGEMFSEVCVQQRVEKSHTTAWLRRRNFRVPNSNANELKQRT